MDAMVGKNRKVGRLRSLSTCAGPRPAAGRALASTTLVAVSRLRALAPAGLLIAAVGLGTWLLLRAGWDLDRVRAEVAEAGAWGPTAFVAMFAVAALLPLPRPALSVLAGALFGLPLGLLTAWAGALLGACLGHTLGRLLGRRAMEELGGARAAAYLRGHAFVSVLVLRLAPIVPFVAVNYAAGAAALPLRWFAAGTALGILPATLAYAAAGAHGLDRPALLAVAFGAVILLGLVAARAARLRAEA